MAAAVTGACIMHLSKRLSSTHPLFCWKSTPQSHHSCIYVLTGTLTRRAGTQVRAHTCSAHIQTPFPLWWQILPELAPICESCRGVLYQSNSPVICLSQMDPRVEKGPCLVATMAGQFGSKPPMIQIKNNHIFPELWGVRGQLSNKGVTLIITAWLGLIH